MSVVGWAGAWRRCATVRRNQVTGAVLPRRVLIGCGADCPGPTRVAAVAGHRCPDRAGEANRRRRWPSGARTGQAGHPSQSRAVGSRGGRRGYPVGRRDGRRRYRGGSSRRRSRTRTQTARQRVDGPRVVRRSSSTRSVVSKSGLGRPMRWPSASVNSCRWARSQRANASLMAVASCAKVWVRAAASSRPGRGQKRSPRPSTSSMPTESQLRSPRRAVLSRRRRGLGAQVVMHRSLSHLRGTCSVQTPFADSCAVQCDSFRLEGSAGIVVVEFITRIVAAGR